MPALLEEALLRLVDKRSLQYLSFGARNMHHMEGMALPDTSHALSLCPVPELWETLPPMHSSCKMTRASDCTHHTDHMPFDPINGHRSGRHGIAYLRFRV